MPELIDLVRRFWTPASSSSSHVLVITGTVGPVWSRGAWRWGREIEYLRCGRYLTRHLGWWHRRSYQSTFLASEWPE